MAAISIAAGDPLQPAGLTGYLEVVEADEAAPAARGIAPTKKRRAGNKSRKKKSRGKN